MHARRGLWRTSLHDTLSRCGWAHDTGVQLVARKELVRCTTTAGNHGSTKLWLRAPPWPSPAHHCPIMLRRRRNQPRGLHSRTACSAPPRALAPLALPIQGWQARFRLGSCPARVGDSHANPAATPKGCASSAGVGAHHNMRAWRPACQSLGGHQAGSRQGACATGSAVVCCMSATRPTA